MSKYDKFSMDPVICLKCEHVWDYATDCCPKCAGTRIRLYMDWSNPDDMVCPTYLPYADTYDNNDEGHFEGDFPNYYKDDREE
jgi:hypothetical protein